MRGSACQKALCLTVLTSAILIASADEAHNLLARRHGLVAQQPPAVAGPVLDVLDNLQHHRHYDQYTTTTNPTPTIPLRIEIVGKGEVAEGGRQAVRVHPRQLGLGDIGGILSALNPAIVSAIAPAVSQAAVAAPAASAILASTPSAGLVPDLLDPAISGLAAPLSSLLANIQTAIAAPLGSAVNAAASGVAVPITAIAAPLETALAPVIAAAVTPLVSVLVPIIGAGILPSAAGALGTLAGPLESALVAPVASALAPILSNAIAAALPAVTPLEGQLASNLGPILSVIDGDILPLVTAAVAPVLSIVGPLVTPLSPVFCALMPAEQPVGGSLTALIPVQCVTVSSGNVVPIATTVAPALMSANAASSGFVTSVAGGSTAAATIMGSTNSQSFPAATVVPSDAAITAAATTAGLLTPASGAAETSQALSAALSFPGSDGGVSLSIISSAYLGNVSAVANPLASFATTPAAATGSALPAVVPDNVSGISSSLTDTPATTAVDSGAVTGTALPAVVATEASPVAATPVPTTLLTVAAPCPCAIQGSSAAASPAPVASPPMAPIPISSDIPTPVTAAPVTSSIPVAGGQLIITAYGPNTIVLAGSTLSPGGPAATINGYVYSIPSSGMPIVFYPASTDDSAPISTPSAAAVEATPAGVSDPLPTAASPLAAAIPTTITITAPCPLAAAAAAAAGSVTPAVSDVSAALATETSVAGIVIGQALAAIFNPVTSSSLQIATATQTLRSIITTSTAPDTAPLIASGCSFVNGSSYISTSSGNPYTVLCNINYPNRDIKPYLTTSSFDTCVQQCDAMDKNARTRPCAAALFVPDAPAGAANCYLKYAVDNPTVATIPMEAAVLVGTGNVVDNGVGVPVVVSDRSQRKQIVAAQLAAASLGSLLVGIPSTSDLASVVAVTAVNSLVSIIPALSTASIAIVTTVPEVLGLPSIGATSVVQQLTANGASQVSALAASVSAAASPVSLTGLLASTTIIPPLSMLSIAPLTTVVSTVPTTAAVEAPSLNSSAVSIAMPSASVLAGQSPDATRVVYASGTHVLQPVISSTIILGPSLNQPTNQYIDAPAQPVSSLPADVNVPVVDSSLATAYPVSSNTGILSINSTTRSLLSSLTTVPLISRDGGKGGYLGGQNIFMFADTGVYTTPTTSTDGDFVGYAGSSVATDVGQRATYGNAVVLQDGVGEWANSSGAMRGFVPLTQAELAYNLANQGRGQRYAIWPESSMIPLNSTAAFIVPPIIFDDVDSTTGAATFTYTGNTLVTITAGGEGGPVAERTVGRMFNATQVEWGCVGGIRSWGASGIGGNDGLVYLFGNVQGGLLLARANVTNVANTNTYQFWTGSGWSEGAPASDSTAYFVQGSFMDVDLFYSPRHLTFILTYTNTHGDSTIYTRYLAAPQALIPPYAGGDPAADLVESITRYQWSSEQVLLRSGTGLAGAYTYAAGVHLGYFGQNDIGNGGDRMLLSWTAPTGQDPGSNNTAYQIVTGIVVFN